MPSVGACGTFCCAFGTGRKQSALNFLFLIILAHPENFPFFSVPVLLFSCSPVFLFFSFPVLQFSRSPVFPFSNFPVLQFSCSPVFPFFSFPILQFFYFSIFPFSSFSVFPFSNFPIFLFFTFPILQFSHFPFSCLSPNSPVFSFHSFSFYLFFPPLLMLLVSFQYLLSCTYNYSVSKQLLLQDWAVEKCC